MEGKKTWETVMKTVVCEISGGGWEDYVSVRTWAEPCVSKSVIGQNNDLKLCLIADLVAQRQLKAAEVCLSLSVQIFYASATSIKP